MKPVSLTILVILLALPLAATAETWKNVSLMDSYCLKDAKAEPDKHTKDCALQCAEGGYGLITADGAFLSFDAAGNEKTVDALKATSKSDHLRVTVEGTRDGETIAVKSLKIE